MSKKIINKDIGFTINIETNLKIVDFLDITFNLNNGRYRHVKSQTHIQSIHHKLAITENNRPLDKNFCNGVFNSYKCHNEQALKDSGCADFVLNLKKTTSIQQIESAAQYLV